MTGGRKKLPSSPLRYIAVQCNSCHRMGEDPDAESVAELRDMLEERGWLIHRSMNIDYCSVCVKEYRFSKK